MKKVFLALLAVVAMVACEDNLDGNNGIATEFDFAFNESGVCYSTKFNGISHTTFIKKVVGNGWEYDSSYEIFKNGNISKEDFYSTVDGGSDPHLYFETESVYKTFIYEDPNIIPVPHPYVYYDTEFIFDDSKLFSVLDGNRNFYEYLILSVNEEFMRCIMRFNMKDYILITFKRMTPEKLQEYLQRHTYDMTWRPKE